jgi:hypothetical protein
MILKGLFALSMQGCDSKWVTDSVDSNVTRSLFRLYNGFAFLMLRRGQRAARRKTEGKTWAEKEMPGDFCG